MAAARIQAAAAATSLSSEFLDGQATAPDTKAAMATRASHRATTAPRPTGAAGVAIVVVATVAEEVATKLMVENLPSGPDDYYGIRIAPGENLAGRFPQVAVRARMYRLEDDGASDLARRKRAAKDRGRNVTERHEKAIAAIERRQRGESDLEPVDPKIAEIRIESHRQAIRRHSAGLDEAPAVNVVAPVARRVAREDRRRSRKKAIEQKGKGDKPGQ